MGLQWYEPFSLTEWLKRLFSFLNITVLLVTALMVFSEFRFDWVEKMIGDYLISTNTLRPETGLIWEAGRQASNAHEYLDTIASQKENTQESVYQVSSFSELASTIAPGDWIPIDASIFKQLYLSLDRGAAEKLIEPAVLVWLLNSGVLERIFCEGVEGGGLGIYFVDTQNRVIKKIVASGVDIQGLETGFRPEEGRLEDIPGFEGRIYPVDVFFNALLTLPEDMLPDLVSHPDLLLKQEYQISRVGISNEAANGYIRLGFEVDGENGKQVIFMNSREWAIWQLSLNLNRQGE